MAHLVSLIDDLGFQAIHAMRDGLDYRNKVAMIRSYFRIAGMFSPWVRRTLDYVTGRWLVAVRRAQRVIRYIGSSAFDVYERDSVLFVT